jgi:hypothetical protein
MGADAVGEGNPGSDGSGRARLRPSRGFQRCPVLQRQPPKLRARLIPLAKNLRMKRLASHSGIYPSDKGRVSCGAIGAGG